MSHPGFFSLFLLFLIWGVFLSLSILASFLFEEFHFNIRCWLLFYVGSFSYRSHAHFIFYFGSFSYTSRAALIFMWGVSLTHPVLVSFIIWGVSLTQSVLFFLLLFFYLFIFFFFLSGKFLLHIPCWLHFYLGSFSYTSMLVSQKNILGSIPYTSRAGFIFIWAVSLTHPVLVLIWSADFLLHIPC